MKFQIFHPEKFKNWYFAELGQGFSKPYFPKWNLFVKNWFWIRSVKMQLIRNFWIFGQKFEIEKHDIGVVCIVLLNE